MNGHDETHGEFRYSSAHLAATIVGCAAFLSEQSFLVDDRS
ncbi:hypothetical protein RRSWK_03168 [Rhodopirellula sp. SWK7]|nr:hypothetical protein RRSWK_03168 [Rhodopirellula sp. SWK7]